MNLQDLISNNRSNQLENLYPKQIPACNITQANQLHISVFLFAITSWTLFSLIDWYLARELSRTWCATEWIRVRVYYASVRAKLYRTLWAYCELIHPILVSAVYSLKLIEQRNAYRSRGAEDGTPVRNYQCKQSRPRVCKLRPENITYNRTRSYTSKFSISVSLYIEWERERERERVRENPFLFALEIC